MSNAPFSPPFESFPSEVRAAARRFLALQAEPGAPADEDLPALTRMKEGSEGSETKEGSEGSERSESSENSENTERSEFSEFSEFSERAAGASAGEHPTAAHAGEWGPVLRTAVPDRA
ncbi:hypothetical protein AB0953_13320 [Streptomyces sp. NPDC046866]|uniref:hypothetical protein n=1 Tax=Streptomyces sp. NPDC046866 TaxID=3154921 RepID=UPI003455F77F